MEATSQNCFPVASRLAFWTKRCRANVHSQVLPEKHLQRRSQQSAASAKLHSQCQVDQATCDGFDAGICSAVRRVRAMNVAGQPQPTHGGKVIHFSFLGRLAAVVAPSPVLLIAVRLEREHGVPLCSRPPTPRHSEDTDTRILRMCHPLLANMWACQSGRAEMCCLASGARSRRCIVSAWSSPPPSCRCESSSSSSFEQRTLLELFEEQRALSKTRKRERRHGREHFVLQPPAHPAESSLHGQQRKLVSNRLLIRSTASRFSASPRALH